MMFFMFRKLILPIFLLALLLLISHTYSNHRIIPVTFLLPGNESILSEKYDLELKKFIIDVAKMKCDEITGVYVKDKFQFPVIQQPVDRAAYVSSSEDVVTEFAQVTHYGSIGLLAHNTLAGQDFYELKNLDQIHIVFGNGNTQQYVVSEIRQFHALSPSSPYSSFVELSDPDRQINYENLFLEIYGKPNRLVLQTCIAGPSSDSWGRYFIIAEPLNKYP